MILGYAWMILPCTSCEQRLKILQISVQFPYISSRNLAGQDAKHGFKPRPRCIGARLLVYCLQGRLESRRMNKSWVDRLRFNCSR